MLRELPLKEGFEYEVPASEPRDIEANDSLWLAFAKIWAKASQSLSLTPQPIEEHTTYEIDSQLDNQKTILAKGEITLPNNPANGFMVTIKSNSQSAISIKAGTSVSINDYIEKITLKKRYSSVRLVYASASDPGNGKWHIIHQHGEIE